EESGSLLLGVLNPTGRCCLPDGPRSLDRIGCCACFFRLLNHNMRYGVFSHNNVNSFVPQLAHASYKAITSARNGLNVLVCIADFAKSLPQREYMTREVAFFDEGVGPDLLHQFFFVEDVSAVFNQHD